MKKAKPQAIEPKPSRREKNVKDRCERDLRDLAQFVETRLEAILVDTRDEDGVADKPDLPVRFTTESVEWDNRLTAIILSAAFVYDRLNGAMPGTRKATRTKAIRKALGFTYP